MATRKKPCKEVDVSARSGLPQAYYQLHALLETVRAMQCYEDDLCTLVNEIRRTGKVNAGVRRDLLKTLHSIPAMRLQAELDACFEALEEAAA